MGRCGLRREPWAPLSIAAAIAARASPCADEPLPIRVVEMDEDTLGRLPVDRADRGRLIAADYPHTASICAERVVPDLVRLTIRPTRNKEALMSASGLEVFDKTLQTTHVWLDEIMADLGTDRQGAYHALSGVLRTLRDRMPVELAAHLGAQLPMLVRGIYFDQWRPAEQPQKFRSLDEFLTAVQGNFGPTKPIDVQEATRAVFKVLARHVAEGQVAKVMHSMPEEVRAMWEGIEPR